MVTISCLKSAIAWIWTWVVNDWLVRDGMMEVFMTVAAVNVVVYSSTILFYIRGKSFRIWIQRSSFLRRAGLD
jgi:hypothetical protein